MKKLQKSSNKKPIFVYIYGPVAVGKLTVAKELQKLTGYKIFHNHMLIDLTKELFGEDKKVKPFFREKLYYYIINSLSKFKIPTIFTHAFAYNFTFKTGTTDPEYIKNTEKIIVKNGGIFYGVHLISDDNKLLKRIKNKSRKKYTKLKKATVLKELLKKYDHSTSAPIKNNLVIDNTNLKPNRVAEMIVNHFKIK